MKSALGSSNSPMTTSFIHLLFPSITLGRPGGASLMTASEGKRIPDPCLSPKKNKKAAGIQKTSSALEHKLPCKGQQERLSVQDHLFRASRWGNSLTPPTVKHEKTDMIVSRYGFLSFSPAPFPEHLLCEGHGEGLWAPS